MIVAVADHSQARIFRYVEGEIAFVESVERKLMADQPYHMGRPPRAGFSSNTRGRTGTDAAQKEEQSATSHMLAETASRIGALAKDSAWIVIGGIPDVATAALRQLAPDAARVPCEPNTSTSTRRKRRWPNVRETPHPDYAMPTT